MVLGAIVGFGFGILPDLKAETKEIESMKNELEELKSVNAKFEAAFSKLLSAIKVSCCHLPAVISRLVICLRRGGINVDTPNNLNV